MEIYKIVAVGVVAAILIVYLKSINSELAMPLTVCSGIIILIMSVSYAVEFFGFFSDLFSISGIDSGVFTVIVKIIGISYVIEFATSLIEDFGLKSISDKVAFGGKILILTLSMPIIKNLVEIVVSMV